MNTTNAGNGTGAYTGGIPLNVTLHAWPVPKLQPDQKQYNQTDAISYRNSGSAKNFTRFHNLNATGYVAIDEDITDTGLTDVQTLILAGIATVIPLLIAVGTILGIRFLWRRYRQRKGEGYEGVLQREESSDPLGKIQGHSIPQELKMSESQFTVTPGEELTSTSSPQVLTPKSNGSVITMTLKNNHLIVETEETSDSLDGIKIESKGTTTKYVTPTAPDFRVDITSTRTPDYNKGQSGTSSPEPDGSSTEILSSTDHGALVHCPPEEIEEEIDKGSCNTGLSQSDLSVSSSESQNPSYRYGNQMGYDSGGYGYPEYSGYSTLVEKNKPHTTNLLGPKENKAYVRSPSLMERTDSIKVDDSVPKEKDVLLSDIQSRARNIIKKEKDDDDKYQEEQRALGNGDLSPKKSTETDADGKRRLSDALINESTNQKEAKRASLPNFAPLTGKAPRFEQLKNEMSPLEEVECYPNSVGATANANS